MARVKIVQADGDKAYGDQNTDGSNSIRGIYEDMRRVGATARVMLVATAAKRWKVAPGGLRRPGPHGHPCADGTRVRLRRVGARGGQAEGAGREGRRAAAEHRAAPPRQAVAAARRARVRDRPGDLRRGHHDCPGMLTAVIARPPVVGGKVARFDATRALAVPGVRKVIEMPAPKPPYAFQPWGGRRGGRGSHVGRDAWPRGARRHLGPWAERHLRFGPVSRGPRQGRARSRERSRAKSATRRRR